jgi:phosphomethylpyrimidine synthase
MSTHSEQFIDKITCLDGTTKYQFINSSKVYVQGSRSDLLVAMREIKLSDTLTQKGNNEGP